MRTCKHCGALESDVRWVTKHGKNRGLTCLACEAIRSKEAMRKRLATPEGREASRRASRKCLSTSTGLKAHRESTKRIRSTLEGRAKQNKASRLYKKENPDKSNAHNAKRRALKLQRTPPWLNSGHQKSIEQYYTEAQRLTRETGVPHHVDHIVPLRGKLVSGLHVPWNLQILTATENSSKGNRYEASH